MMTQEPDGSALLQRTAWGSILTVATVLGTLGAACAAPFAALAALAAIFLPRRDAFVLIGVNWIATQVIGFVWLHYPLNWECYRGGLNLGMAALCATAAAMCAHWAVRRAGWPVAMIGPFVAAFVAYEGVLFAMSPWRNGGDFAWPVVLYIFKVNGIAFAILLLLQRIAMAIGLSMPRALIKLYVTAQHDGANDLP
jgi:hypothetical protein